MPVMMPFMWGVLVVLSKLDPRRANIEKFRDTIDVFVIAVMAVMAAIQVGIIGSALGWPIPVGRMAPIAIGALFVLLGAPAAPFSVEFLLRDQDTVDVEQRIRVDAHTPHGRLRHGPQRTAPGARRHSGDSSLVLRRHWWRCRDAAGGSGLFVRHLARRTAPELAVLGLSQR